MTTARMIAILDNMLALVCVAGLVLALTALLLG
jgi:hypothetical protein